MTTRRTGRADQGRVTPRTPDARAADPVAAPVARPRTAAEVLALQRAVGNEAVAAILAEQSAVQRATAQEVLDGTGRPLAAPVRAEMETKLGADFSTVRVHTGASAEQSAAALGARAYTSGENIVLGAGGDDRHTLAHELSHVIQQRSGPVSGTDNGAGLSVSDPSDTFERAAEESARRALDEPAPRAAPHAGRVAGGHHHAWPIQRDTLASLLINLPENMVKNSRVTKKLEQWTASNKLDVPVTLPAADGPRTRSVSANVNRARDERLTINGRSGTARITWSDLIDGEKISMSAGPRDVTVSPHGGAALGAAVNRLLDLMDTLPFSRDRDLSAFAPILMDWLVRKRSHGGGKLEVETTPPKDGAGARINIEGRPPWDEQAGQIAIGGGENRRHIIAWHTMRQAFQKILNEALKDGPDITTRMSRLVDVLERVSTAPDPEEAQPEESAGEGSGSAVADPQPSQTTDTTDADEPSQTTPVPETQPSQSATTEAGAKELSTKLTAAVKKVLTLMSNNPFNLWAGEGVVNTSINRVRWQLSARLEKFSDDKQLLKDVLPRVRKGAATNNEDQAVWTEVRNALAAESSTRKERQLLESDRPDDVQHRAEVRSTLQSMIDSFDIDIPVSSITSSGAGQSSSTYGSLADQRAAVKNVLAPDEGFTGLAQEVLAMVNNPLPKDFDALIKKVEDWVERFLRPDTMQTTFSGGRRTVGERP